MEILAVFCYILNNYLYSAYERQVTRWHNIRFTSYCTIRSRRFLGMVSVRTCKTNYMKQQQQTSDILFGVFFLSTLVLIIINL